jgi:hypothetical protein
MMLNRGDREKMFKLVTASVLTGLSIAISSTGLAFAGGDEGLETPTTTPGGYSVRVTYTGSAAPKGGGTGKVIPSIPPTCWWEVFEGGDPASVKAAIDKQYNQPHYSGIQYLALYGPRQRFDDAVTNKSAITWYVMNCQGGKINTPDALAYAGQSIAFYGERYPILVQGFPAGQDPPPPLVDPEVLRDAAFAAMEIPKPTIERNPKATGTNATLVNLPTWFWVGQANRGPYDITATAGPVSATVVVKSTAWNLFSDFGGAACTEEQITTAYAPGLSDDSACTLSFNRVSAGAGHTVRLQTEWAATWSGVRIDGSTVGPLADLPSQTTEATTVVPVVEVQVPNR